MILLDETLPMALRHHLAEFDVVTVQFQGWSGKQNGELIGLIDGRFDGFITGDKNLRSTPRRPAGETPCYPAGPPPRRWRNVAGASRARPLSGRLALIQAGVGRDAPATVWREHASHFPAPAFSQILLRGRSSAASRTERRLNWLNLLDRQDAGRSVHYTRRRTRLTGFDP